MLTCQCIIMNWRDELVATICLRSLPKAVPNVMQASVKRMKPLLFEDASQTEGEARYRER